MYSNIYNLSFINDINNDVLQKKEYCLNNTYYYILKYNRSLLNVNNYHDIGILRSVVFKNDKILSFSPTKTLNYDYFIFNNIPNMCIAEEYVEGTMINLFYDIELNNWEISTKSCVGGNSKFFENQKNFNNLFFDICNELNIDLNNFSKNYCYSFVIQHPENDFVLNINVKKLYLIAVYQIDNINLLVKEIPKIEYNILNLPNNLSHPYWHYFNSYDELKNYYGSINTPINIMGVIIKNMNGDRTKIRNPNYNYVKKLKGNSRKLQYHFLELYKNDKINEYLYYFPNNSLKFNMYKKILYNYTDTLYSNYVSCFVKKEKVLNEYPFNYKNHMFFLHEKYIKNKNENKDKDKKFFIDKKFVINYVKNLEIPRLMFSLNYDFKELDNINNTNNSNIITNTDINTNTDIIIILILILILILI